MDAAPVGAAEPYSVCVVGAGGVGGLFAARLAQCAGVTVHCIARGAHLAAIQRRGIVVKSLAGDATVPVASATTSPADVGVVDLVIVALKAWQLEELDLRPLVGPRTLVMPTQNGVDAPERLGALLGAAHVVGGYTRVTSLVQGAGGVHHTAIHPAVQGTGVLPTSAPWAAEELRRCAAAWARSAFLRLVVEEDVLLSMWRKLTVMAPYSTVCATARCPIGPVLSSPDARAVLLSCMHETAAVARAAGVAMRDADVEAACAVLAALPPGCTPSMQRDILAARPSELDDQAGAVVRIGAQRGVPTPVLGALYALLRPQERCARGELAMPAMLEEGFGSEPEYHI